MDKGTLARTITGLIMAIIDLVAVFGVDVNITEASVLSVVSIVVGIVLYYKNNDHTPVARKTTALMRRVKKLIATGDLTILDKIDKLLEEAEQND